MISQEKCKIFLQWEKPIIACFEIYTFLLAAALFASWPHLCILLPSNMLTQNACRSGNRQHPVWRTFQITKWSLFWKRGIRSVAAVLFLLLPTCPLLDSFFLKKKIWEKLTRSIVPMDVYLVWKVEWVCEYQHSVKKPSPLLTDRSKL